MTGMPKERVGGAEVAGRARTALIAGLSLELARSAGFRLYSRYRREV